MGKSMVSGFDFPMNVVNPFNKPPSHEISGALPGWPLGHQPIVAHAGAAEGHGLQVFHQTVLQDLQHLGKKPFEASLGSKKQQDL